MRGNVPTTTVLAVLAVLGIIYTAAKKYGPDLRRIFRFLDAWEGYTGPDGKHVPGVLERLTGVEVSAATSASAVAALDKRVEHVSEQLDEVKASVEDVKTSQLAKAAELTQIRTTVEELRGLVGTEDAPTDPAT